MLLELAARVDEDKMIRKEFILKTLNAQNAWDIPIVLIPARNKNQRHPLLKLG